MYYTKCESGRNRKLDYRINERNKNGDIGIKRNGVQRKIRKEANPCLPPESLKKLARYTSSGKLQARELCTSYEPHPDGNGTSTGSQEGLATYGPTQHEQTNEYNNMEL